MIDEIDRKLLDLLQANARVSNAEMAEAVGLTVSSVHERVKKLERKGVIKGYVAVLDPDKLGKPLLAFLRLTVSSHESAQSRSGPCAIQNRTSWNVTTWPGRIASSSRSGPRDRSSWSGFSPPSAGARTRAGRSRTSSCPRTRNPHELPPLQWSKETDMSTLDLSLLMNGVPRGAVRGAARGAESPADFPLRMVLVEGEALRLPLSRLRRERPLGHRVDHAVRLGYAAAGRGTSFDLSAAADRAVDLPHRDRAPALRGALSRSTGLARRSELQSR